ncbi:MAG: hypothetical protein ACOCV2_14630 [Persicimonas sp.]
MNDRTRQVALQAVGMGLALVVGILIGARACTSEPEPEVVEREADCSPKVVERCPDTGQPDAGPAEPDAATHEPEPAREMPDAGGPDPAEQRRELLRWAQDQSDGLIGCRRHSPETAAVIVTLRLNDEAEIDEVDVTTPDDEDASARALTCISDRIAEWEPPADLVADRRELVFRLDL